MQINIIMDRSINVTKLDAAEWQLKAAIRMVIYRQDPISTHTLACSAHQILYDLARRVGLSSQLKDIVPNRKKRLWINMLNCSYNFFRHADKDSDEAIDFDPATSHFFILDATHLYQALNDKLFYEGAIFRLWFNKTYPEYAIEAAEDALLPNVLHMVGHFFTDNDFVDYLQLIDKYGLTYVGEEPSASACGQ